jgi:type VI secretion system protein ImpL
MLAFFKRRVVIVVIGLVLLAAFIWFAGPLFAFGPYRPLETEMARLITILLVIVFWAGSRWLKRQRAKRASDQIAAAVVGQAAVEAPSPDVVRLREQFEKAVAALKQKRRDGHTLYELPWYIIIGAPGAGKTTALVKSGLHFPLEQEVGRGAVRGIGGTRNCDWWFTDEAIFLDTAGRYTTHDSDAAADSTGWAEFLALLRKYRSRRPVNGVLLAISAQDLLTEGAREREAHIDALRRRLDELNRELRIQLPVYLLITKCDLISGFTEYFDDLLSAEGRAQIWGVTFPYDQTLKGEAASRFGAEFDALLTRLNERVMARVAGERDRRRRPKIFGFPQQVAMLRDALTEFVTTVFSTTRFDRQVLLRGVYFTSATQEGTPIDRLLGAMSRRFGVAPDVMAPSPGKEKAYFIERLLKDVIIGESGVAGINRRLEATQAAIQLAAYAAIAVLTVAGLVALSVSYRNNRAFVATVAEQSAQLSTVPSSATGAPLDRVLPRLDAVRRVSDVANRYRGDTPWLRMGWGLYEGNALGDAARDAYTRELNGALIGALKTRFETRLREYATEPEKLYEYLKGYLMLGHPERLNATHVGFLADLEWEALYSFDEQAVRRLSSHFRALLTDEGGLRPMPIDERLVAQARSTIQQASIPVLMFNQIKSTYSDDATRALHLDVAAGVGVEQVFRRKTGRPLSTPISALYTKAVFEEVTGRSTDQLVRQFAEDQWVWGEERLAVAATAKLGADLIAVYEKDYISAWDAILADLELAPLGTLDRTKEALAILGRPTSPLRGLLKAVDDNTFLVKPEDPAQQKAADGVAGRLGAVFNKGKAVLGIPTVKPGLAITQHFAGLHQLVSGEGGGGARLDGVLQQIQQIQQKLVQVGREAGLNTPDNPKTMADIRISAEALSNDADALPPMVAPLVKQLGNSTALVTGSELRGTLATKYREEVVTECRALLAGRFPLVSTGPDLPVADFGRLFGAEGVYESFFRSELRDLVERQGDGWGWRPGAAGSVNLDQFEAAERIKRQFFPRGGPVPEMTFTVTPIELDEASKQFALEYDGQTIVNRHGPERSWTVTWPGDKGGTVVARFDEASGAQPSLVFDGPWGWFRLMAAGQVQRQSETRFVLTLGTGGHRTRLRVDANSVWNPFARSDLQQFRCG